MVVTNPNEIVMTLEQISEKSGVSVRDVRQALRRGDLVSQEVPSVQQWLMGLIGKEKDPSRRKNLIMRIVTGKKEANQHGKFKG